MKEFYYFFFLRRSGVVEEGRRSSSNSIIRIIVTLDLSRRKHCLLPLKIFASQNERSVTVLETYVYWKAKIIFCSLQWRAERGEGLGGSNPPPPEVSKSLQNRAKLNPNVKTVKND